MVGSTQSCLKACITGILAALVWGGVAAAECMSDYQEQIDDYEETIVRNILMAAQGDIERFFDLDLDGFCIEYEPDTAYFIHVAPDYDAIILGEDFLFEMSSAPWNFNSLISILAHEGAHGFQVKHDLISSLDFDSGGYVKCVELHADFMAGGFMRWSSGKYKMELPKLSELFYTLGDHEYTKRTHHGSPPERFLAFKNGFDAPADDEETLAVMGLAYVYGENCGNG